MKLIKVMQGTVACRVSSDDVVPAASPPFQDVLAAVKARYQFPAEPQPLGLQIGEGQTSSQYALQNGKFVLGEESFPIIQLVMEVSGDVVTSTSTDIANSIMDDLTGFLDEKFKYNFHSVEKKKSFVSAVIVEFDERFEEKIPALTSILKIVNEGRDINSPFQMLRLGFGSGMKPQAVFPLPFIPQSQLDLIENADYLIERRAGAALARNRYFCSAPKTTADHIRTLEEIEKVLASKK